MVGLVLLGVASGCCSGDHTANAWINSTAGASPTLCDTPCQYDPAKAFGSMQAAYDALKATGCGAQHVFYKAGSYPDQAAQLKTSGNLSCQRGCHLAARWPDGSSQSQDFADCKSFSPEPGAQVTVHGLQLEAPYVRVIGLTVDRGCKAADAFCTGGLSIGGSTATSRSGSFNCTNSKTGEIIVAGVTANGTFSDQGSNDQTAIVDSNLGPAWEARSGKGLSSPIHDCINANNSKTYGVNKHLIIRNTTIHDYLVFPPASHNECIHFYGGVDWIFENDKMLNCAGNTIAFQATPCAGGGCSGYSPIIDHGRIENFVGGDPCANPDVEGAPPNEPCNVIEGGGITIRCGNPSDTQNITFSHMASLRPIFFQTSAQPLQCNQGGGTWPRNAGFTLVGDVLPSLVNATGYPDGYPDSGHNVFAGHNGPVASTDVKTSTPIAEMFTDPASPKYDFSLPSNSPGVNIVPCQILPSPPFALGPAIRPLGPECDSGAYER